MPLREHLMILVVMILYSRPVKFGISVFVDIVAVRYLYSMPQG